MTDANAFGFGDTVRIKEGPETAQAKIAGLEGTVYGFTTPSLTGVETVGPLSEDFALNVHVDSLNQGYWLDPGNIELVERPEAMEFSIAGKTIRVTQKDGEYNEAVILQRPWWKFW
ncbi:hypothetical protein [Lysobacter auxotrophicus]|uniref:DUF5666 domain-containing protein n=1 Tax=Lysobacter auxotrophicus TaxID=2992573 RepID=A0ABN6UK85_9GAMM|nr:hypothetical protein [Lysobacter auxotrophicus]BDU16664.1 hypothetical protein LA521A_18650 [Lysobacter auxotrophicus]